MRDQSIMLPSPRSAVADPALFRPDWTKGQIRNENLLWLDKNENTDPALLRVTTKVLRELEPHAVFSYPECAPLYKKLADHLEVRPENLVLTPGSDGAIRSVFEAFIDPGDVVLHTTPTFAMYPVYSQMYGVRSHTLEYRPSKDGPVLRAQEIVEAIDRIRPKLVCLPNPDSPTGTVFMPEDMRRIIEAAASAGALMLVDEAYFPFCPQTVLPWINTYKNLVIARTFAKAWGLAGLRIGYAAGSPEVVKLLHKVRSMYEVNTVAVVAVTRMLDYVGEMLASVRRLNEGRDSFIDAMNRLGFRTIKPNGNFLHVEFGSYSQAVHDALKDLVLYRLDSKDPCLAGFSRFTATTVELYQPVIDRIRNARG